MEPLNSPYGNGPQNLESPVPDINVSPIETMAQQITKVKTPSPVDGAYVPQNETPPDPYAALEADLSANYAALEADLAEPEESPEDFEVAESNTTLGVDTDLGQQIRDLPVRIQANLAESDEAKLATLQKTLGVANVRKKNGNIFYRRPGEKAFRELDPATFEVVNDLFSDFYRESIEGMFGAAGAVVGGGAGVAAGAPTGPGALATGAAGATAGYGLGTALGSLTADAIGELFLGVQRPDRAEGLEGALQRTGAALEKGAFASLFKGFADKLLARKQSVEALKKLAETPKEQVLRESVKQNIKTLDDLRTLGYTKTIGDTGIEVPTHQLVPHLPKVQQLATSVADEKAFLQAQKIASENIHASVLDLVEEAADLSRGRLKETVRSGVPGVKSVSVEDINGLFNGVRRAEGALIEQFRNKASAETVKRFALPAPNTQTALKGIFEQLGIRTDVSYQNAKLLFPDDDSLAQMLGTDSKAYINGLKKDLQKVFDLSTRAGGGMKIDDLIGQSRLIGAKNEGARRVGGLYKKMIGQLSSALRADSREQMGKLLDPEDAAAYAHSMKRFQNVAQSMDQLSSLLDDNVGLNVFAKGLVNKGKNGLPNLRAAKQFLLQEDPQKYKAVVGEYFEELALKHRDPDRVGGFNASGMRKELAGLGSEYLDELFPQGVGANKSLVLRSFDLADQVEKSILRNSPDDKLVKEGQQILSKLGWAAGKINLISAMMSFGTKESRMLKLLSREGVESFIKDVPKAEKGRMRQTLNAVLEMARANGVLKTARMGALNAPIATAAGGVQNLREGLTQKFSGGRNSEE